MDTSLYLSPKGRTGPAAFQQAAIALIVIGFVVKILPLLSFSLGAILGLLSLVLIWPWICIWIKRFHDAGKSGWMLLIVVLIMIVLSAIVGKLVQGLMGVDQAAVKAAAMNAKAGGIMAIIQASSAATKSLILPSAISSAVIGLLIVFGANKALKSDPEENQYGPATAG